jgi:hypothetical protein
MIIKPRAWERLRGARVCGETAMVVCRSVSDAGEGGVVETKPGYVWAAPP